MIQVAEASSLAAKCSYPTTVRAVQCAKTMAREAWLAGNCTEILAMGKKCHGIVALF